MNTPVPLDSSIGNMPRLMTDFGVRRMVQRSLANEPRPQAVRAQIVSSITSQARCALNDARERIVRQTMSGEIGVAIDPSQEWSRRNTDTDNQFCIARTEHRNSSAPHGSPTLRPDDS